MNPVIRFAANWSLLFLIATCTGNSAASAPITSYLISPSGVTRSSTNRFFNERNLFIGGSTVHIEWELDDANNQIRRRGGSFQPFNSGPAGFTVADITGLAADPAGNTGLAWVTTSTDNLSYLISPSGVTRSSTNRFFNERDLLFGGSTVHIEWELDDANNRIRRRGGSFQPFNSGPAGFTVADITGLAADPAGNTGLAWVTTSTDNLSYLISPSGVTRSSTNRFFNERDLLFGGSTVHIEWELDDANNRIRRRGGSFQPFNSGPAGFTVADITGLAADPAGNTGLAWITVARELPSVPEPSSYLLIAQASIFLGLVWWRKRSKPVAG